MKKLILLLSISLLSSSTFAQEGKVTKWRGFTINPFITGGGSGTSFELEKYTAIGGGMAAIGCQVGYVLNSHVAFYTGISLNQYNWELPLGVGGVRDIKAKSNYIQIPITVKATTSQFNKVGFQVEAGFNIAKVNSIKETMNYTNSTPSESNTEIDDYTKISSTFYLFYGLRIPFSKSTSMSVGFDNYIFLDNQFINHSSPSKISTAGIRIGIETRLTK